MIQVFIDVIHILDDCKAIGVGVDNVIKIVFTSLMINYFVDSKDGYKIVHDDVTMPLIPVTGCLPEGANDLWKFPKDYNDYWATHDPCSELFLKKEDNAETED